MQSRVYRYFLYTCIFELATIGVSGWMQSYVTEKVNAQEATANSQTQSEFGRETLSAARARELVRKSTDKMGLSLDNLEELDAEIAAILSESRGKLSLDGLQALDEDSAEILTKNPNLAISLNGLTSITPKTAASLSRLRFLALNQLKPDAAVLRELGQAEGIVQLNSLESLEAQAAADLVKRPRILSLDGLKSISADVAKELAASRASFSLNGIEDLTDEAAGAIATRPGGWSFASLKRLQHVGLAVAIATESRGVDLRQLDTVSLECLVALAECPHIVTLGMKELTKEQAEVLSKCKRYLTLNRLPKITDDAIESLLQSNCALRLPALRELNNVELAERLIKNSGSMLDVLVLESLSEPIAKVFTTRKVILPLYRVTAIDLATAKILAEHPGNLILSGLKEMSYEQAEIFAARQGKLHLSSETVMSDKARVMLAANKMISWRVKQKIQP